MKEIYCPTSIVSSPGGGNSGMNLDKRLRILKTMAPSLLANYVERP